jgi:chromatin remodeling complex protein RSC6
VPTKIIGKTPNTKGNTSSKLETKLLEKNQKEMKGGKKKTKSQQHFSHKRLPPPNHLSFFKDTP